MKKLLLSIIGILLLSPAAFASYTDVGFDHPYIEGITYLELLGGSDSADKFYPDRILKQAEFFKILFMVFEEDPDQVEFTNSFEGLKEEAWYAPYAELALKHGLIDKDIFEAGKTMRRAETLELLLQAYGVGNPITPDANRFDLFRDVSKNHPKYISILQAANLGLIEVNEDGYFRSMQGITRGELAQMLYSFDIWGTVELASEEELFYKSEIFANIWYEIQNNFHLTKGEYINEDALFQAAVKGMIFALGDPYSTYLSADEAVSFFTSLNGDFEGIGAVLNEDPRTGRVYIVEVLKDSPAKESGLEAGDIITAVDGVSTEGLFMGDVINRIKGQAGTTVDIEVEREDKILEFTISREQLNLILESGEVVDDNIWLIDMDSFAITSTQNLDIIFKELEAEAPNPKAITLDFRGNLGGYIDAAINLMSLFLAEGETLMQLDYGAYNESLENNSDGPYQDIPLYIFINEFSASSSEIVAASLQEKGAVVIGTQSYGKGTVQEITQYWDDSVLKLSIAEWLSGEGNSIQDIGVTPDIEITETDGSKDLWLEQLLEEVK